MDGLIARRLCRLYYAAGRQYFKGRYFAQAIGALRISGGYRRSAKGAAIGMLSRCLLPVGRSDPRGTPELR